MLKFSDEYTKKMASVKFDEDFKKNTSALLTAALERKEQKTNMKNKKTLRILIAAAILVLLTVSAGAAAKFFLPSYFENAGMQFENVKTVIDTDKATDETVQTVQKTYETEDYIITFEAIVDANVLNADVGLIAPEDGEMTLAVFTIRRTDGKSVYTVFDPEDDKTLTRYDLGFLPLIKGYYPNPNMWYEEVLNWTPYEENGVLYMLCDITPLNAFADKELSIAVTDSFLINCDILGMTEDGEFYYKEGTGHIPALFDFDLPDERADHEKAAQLMSERPFLSYEEWHSAAEADE